MFKKASIVFISLVGVVVGLASCTKEVSLNTYPIQFCHEGEVASIDLCQLELSEHQRMYFFSSNPLTPEEEELSWTIQLPEHYRITQSELSGESMYMGRFPVIWQPVSNKNNHWVSTTSLAACAHPGMVWKLTLQLEEKGNPEPIQVMATFPVQQ